MEECPVCHKPITGIYRCRNCQEPRCRAYKCGCHSCDSEYDGAYRAQLPPVPPEVEQIRERIAELLGPNFSAAIVLVPKICSNCGGPTTQSGFGFDIADEVYPDYYCSRDVGELNFGRCSCNTLGRIDIERIAMGSDCFLLGVNLDVPPHETWRCTNCGLVYIYAEGDKWDDRPKSGKCGYCGTKTMRKEVS